MKEPQFRLFSLSLPARLVMAAFLYSGAAALQVAGIGGPAFLAPVFLAWAFLALKPASNKPKDQGLEEWRAVSFQEIDRIMASIKEAKKLRLKLAGPVLAGIFALLLMGLASVVSLGVSELLALAFFDLAIFSIPGLFFGGVRVFTPAGMDLKLPCFVALMGESLPKGMVLTPYLRFDKDEEGRDIPEDMRFMLEPARKPRDLIGFQFQAAINDGENGKVPYLYAVALTKGRDGPAYARLRTLRSKRYVVEAGGDGDYGTVVIRQDTGGTGYHTRPSDCVALLKTVLKAEEGLSAG